MQLSYLLVTLAAVGGALADLHDMGYCYSRIQPVGNEKPRTCSNKRDTTPRDNVLMERANYGDNAAATRKACAAYRNRNTGNKQWDKCPDCTSYARYFTGDPNECIITCNSAGSHIGGDEFSYYCKQAGADGSYGY